MLLESAENHDPKCPKIANVRKELNAESVKKCSANRDSMLKAIDEKRYCQANKDLTEIRRLYPSFTCEYEAEINDSIAKATSFFNKAKAAKNDTDKITNCIQAHECCADLPGVEEQIPPPNKAKGFEIKPDVYKKVNVLKWASSNDNLSSYVVVKSDTNQVRRIEDGTVIYKGKSCTYTDKDIIAGNTYYYNLFVERAGRYSECADDKHDGVTSLFDISGVSATPGNKIVNLTWNSVAKGATVNIYIKENGAYKLAASSMSTSCVLSSLTNNKQYDIKIVVEYNISGKKVETTGTELTVVPIAPIKPIDDMRIKSPDKGKFELIWTKSDDGVVEIYSSTSMPSYKAGDMISVDELKKQMNVQPTKALSLNTATTLSPTENGATLEYNGDKPLYLMAVVVRLGSAVTGKIVRASNSGIINARSVDKINNKLHIIIDEPKADSGITEFIVLYSNKAFPLEVTDANAKRKVITKKKFDSEHKLIIDMCDFTCYYFSIFAKIEMDGETSYSPPINCHYNENKTAIAYSIKAKNSLFKKVLEVKMATNDMSDLPSIDIVCMEGRMPINRNEGKVIHSHQKANSVNSIVIPLDPAIIKKKNVYIKAFLTDKTLINKYSIKPPNNKIT